MWLCVKGKGWAEVKFPAVKRCKTKHDAEVLYQMYCDPVNKLYLEFLMPILYEFSRVNKFFQLENGNAYLLLIPNSLMSIWMTQPTICTCVRFGEAKLDSTVETNMKNRCWDFLLEAAKQVQKRLPANINTWKSMSSFNSSVILSQNKPQLATVSIMLKMYTGDLGALDAEYQAISFHEWKVKDDCQAEQFWAKVLNYKDSSGEQCFKDLALFALFLLEMPLSNADIERVFSNEPCKI